MIRSHRRPQWALALLAIVALPALVAGAAENRWNIIWIYSDDHAEHAISAYGSKVNMTPNMDRIANEGMRFRNSFVTNSICGPCRAVIQTGKYNHLCGMLDNSARSVFDGNQQTFPKLLQASGYSTAVIGKWHLVSEPQGYDYFSVLVGQGPYYNPVMIEKEGKVPNTGYTTDIITEKSLEWLKNGRAKDKPFLLMCQHKAPHRNWQPAPRYFNLFDNKTLPEPETLFDDYTGRASPASQQAMTIAKHLTPEDLKLTEPKGLNPDQLKAWKDYYDPRNEEFHKANLTGKELVKWKYQRYMTDYLKCVAAVDDGIGQLLKYLDESGLAKNTIVMYSADQGFYLGDHGWFDKRWMYEESLRTPLLVRWPGTVKAGSLNDDMVLNVDMAETFCEMAGLPVPKDMQGRSLVPLMKGQTPKDWRKSLYYHYYEFPGPHDVRKHEGVRDERYKLINYYTQNEWELFDLKKDPNELKSVYADPAYADVKKRLEAELTRLRTDLKAPENDTRERPAVEKGGAEKGSPKKAGKKKKAADPGKDS